MLSIFILLSMSVLVSALLNPPEELEFIKSSRICIKSIADKYFIDEPTISVFTTDIMRDNTVLKGLYQSEKHLKKKLNFNTFTVEFKEVRKEYSVIVADNLHDLILPEQLDKLSLRNARSKYIFYSFTNGENVLQKFVEAVWNYYIINAVVLMPSIENKTILNIYTWFPYSDKKCGDHISPVLINTCTYGNFQTNTDLFPDKVPINFHGCPVIIRATVWSPFVLPPEDGIILDDVFLNFTDGIEVQLIKAIASATNFTTQFSSSTFPMDWGGSTIDGIATGTIKALREKKADVGIGSFGSTIGRRMYCDNTESHMQEILTWCVPKAQIAPRWKNLLQPFNITAWLSMIIIYFFVSIIVWGLCYSPPKDTSSFKNPNNSLLHIFSVFLGICSSDTPSKVSSRICFIFWLFFGLHFIVAYQAKLMGVLLKPSYEQQISSVEEVFNSKMEYQILPTHRRVYENADDWRVAKILKEWTSCHDSDTCLKRVAYQRDLALCTSKSHAEFDALQYRDADGQPLVYCFDYITYECQVFMTKGYPLKARMNDLIFRIRDSGLIFKWRSDLQWIWMYKYRKTLPIDEGNEQRLTLDHMQGAFVVLALGLIIALLIFILEIVFEKLIKRYLKVNGRVQTKHY